VTSRPTFPIGLELEPVEADNRTGQQHEREPPARVTVPPQLQPPPAAQPRQRPLHSPPMPPQPARRLDPAGRSAAGSHAAEARHDWSGCHTPCPRGSCRVGPAAAPTGRASNTPAWAHSVSRRQQVAGEPQPSSRAGSSRHGVEVRAMNTIAAKQLRSGMARWLRHGAGAGDGAHGASPAALLRHPGRGAALRPGGHPRAHRPVGLEPAAPAPRTRTGRAAAGPHHPPRGAHPGREGLAGRSPPDPRAGRAGGPGRPTCRQLGP
jgi:hypothetical protein